MHVVHCHCPVVCRLHYSMYWASRALGLGVSPSARPRRPKGTNWAEVLYCTTTLIRLPE